MRLPTAVAFALACACSAQSQTYTLKTFAGGGLPENVPAASASLGNATGVAVDSAGAVFVSLGDYHMVVRVDPASGMLTRVAGNGVAGFTVEGGAAAAAQLSGPSGLTADLSGNLYIADAGNFRVRRSPRARYGASRDMARRGTAATAIRR